MKPVNRNTEPDVENDRPDLGPTTSREKVGDDLLKVLEHETTEAHSIDDGVEAVEEHEVSCFNSDVATSDDGNTDVGGSKRGGIIDTVTSNSDDVIASLELGNDAKLLFGCNTSVASNCRSSQSVVTSDHEKSGSSASALLNGIWDFRTVGINDAEHTNDGKILDSRVRNLITEAVCTNHRPRSDELLAKNDDSFRATRSLILNLLELDTGVASECFDRVGLGGPVLGTSGEENIGSTLDDNAVSSSLVIGLENSEHPLVLGVKGDFKDARSSFLETVSIRTSCSKSEDGAISCITLDSSLMKGKVDGSWVEGCIVAEE
ncbi:hypothetical protein HG530_000358 [Fusarium avenaceum]|nr:hypothetical protein HG530_000358 [Fusarium avenaceum]